ncbi:hypothetical protein B9G55_07960 [Saccharibacillus sp. O16]|nr:hypothetical protein B9G55_07960 [Saccharibacillus sp. O16]
MEWEHVLTVHVAIKTSIHLENSLGDSVVMIPFDGHAEGKYFTGKVQEGGVDTQIIGRHGDRHSLSARYMLHGTDHTGQECDLFIENNGEIDPKLTDVLFRTTPRIITNSQALAFLNNSLLAGEGLPSASGVEIRIYRVV